MARTLCAKIQTFIIMKMNRCIVLVLPLLFLLSSCGTTAQFAQQRFQDGIYSRPEPVAEAVQIYSKDDFAAMAAANIARDANQKDTVYVVVRENDSWYNSPWFAWGSAWAFSWPWRHWAYYSSWYDPWYGWGYPWYSGYWDPWYWDSWYYPHYHNYYPHYWNDYRRPGLSSDGRHFYGPRFLTQGGGSSVSRPGTGSNLNYTRSYSSAGGNYGSAGSSNYRRGSALGSGTAGSGGSVITGTSRPSGSTSNSTVNNNANRRPNSNYNYSRSYGSENSGSYNNSFGSPSRSSQSTRSYTSPGSSYSRGSSYSSPSRSYGGGSGGGGAMRSGGGGNYSRGRR